MVACSKFELNFPSDISSNSKTCLTSLEFSCWNISFLFMHKFLFASPNFLLTFVFCWSAFSSYEVLAVFIGCQYHRIWSSFIRNLVKIFPGIIVFLLIHLYVYDCILKNTVGSTWNISVIDGKNLCILVWRIHFTFYLNISVDDILNVFNWKNFSMFRILLRESQMVWQLVLHNLLISLAVHITALFMCTNVQVKFHAILYQATY